MSVEFEEKVLSKFDALEKRSESFEEKVLLKFDAIDQRFGAIDQRFEAIDQRFEAMDRRFDTFEEKMLSEFAAVREEMQDNSNKINKRIDRLDDRVKSLESIVRKRFDIPELKDRMDATELVVGRHSEQINQLNKKVGIKSATA